MTLLDDFGEGLDPEVKYRIAMFDNLDEDPLIAIMYIEKIYAVFEKKEIKIPTDLKQELELRKKEILRRLESIYQQKKAQLEKMKGIRTTIAVSEGHESRSHRIFGDDWQP